MRKFQSSSELIEKFHKVVEAHRITGEENELNRDADWNLVSDAPGMNSVFYSTTLASDDAVDIAVKGVKVNKADGRVFKVRAVFPIPLNAKTGFKDDYKRN